MVRIVLVIVLELMGTVLKVASRIPSMVLIIADPFDLILELSLPNLGGQYAFHFPLLFIVHHYGLRWLHDLSW